MKLSINKIIHSALVLLTQMTERQGWALDCFSNQRWPKFVQTTAGHEHNEGVAIASHDALDAVIVGGSITQTPWLTVLTGGSAHLGRINLTTRMWAWQKQLAEPSQQALTTITALAIDPSAQKVACYGYKAPFRDRASKVGHIVVLDVSTGAPVSGLLTMTHQVVFYPDSSALMLQPDGRVLLAISRSNPDAVQHN